MNKPINQIPLSHSQMGVFRQCSEKWWKIYQEKQSRPTSPALEFGKDLHTLLAKCVLSSWPTSNIVMDYVDDLVVDYWGAFREYGSQIYPSHFIQSMVDSALTTLESIGVSEVVMVEETIESSGVFKGVLDLIFIDNQEKHWVWDWKTSSSDYKEDQLKNNSQLIAYAYLYKIRFGRLPDYLGFGVINKKTGICTGYKTTRTEEQVRDWESSMLSTYSQIWDNGYRQKDDARCFDWYSRCSFFDQCWGDREVEIVQLEDNFSQF